MNQNSKLIGGSRSSSDSHPEVLKSWLRWIVSSTCTMRIASQAATITTPPAPDLPIAAASTPATIAISIVIPTVYPM